ncbi:hypothetical protein E3P81_02342 [Wallemia ichthyophaga]|uniref:Uncharacterized protein n=1 Tax=Wallemia ichthyophaga TaxID=245174 RepID=A0A4T0L4D3_WALIC|nr:hypothetical protein E3P91_02474 [Wallemia ichthyophaga]TIA81162.1 hypothetical protein E3P98_02279 [Wallemia ichthyophaga]TIA90640.1 hypothetical protein E3P97_02475 [Wallemia ichthyophaga]TIA99427.1 hypothetical protein E3P95_02117 [Wallemia ichthyophaga]TIB00340.1 hypothetical protein E3P94_02241 [Wallemia ichthyophaga]
MPLTKKQILASSAFVIPASLVLGVYLRERQQDVHPDIAQTTQREPIQNTQDLHNHMQSKQFQQSYHSQLKSLKQDHFFLDNQLNRLEEKIKNTEQRMHV